VNMMWHGDVDNKDDNGVGVRTINMFVVVDAKD
jgi:hypothetical protein